jgi:hypothetical protein
MREHGSVTVKAPDGFWEELFSGQFQFKSNYEAIRINGNEIVISVDYYWDVMDEIIELSKEYPDYEFRFKIDTSFLKKLFEIKNGRSELIYAGHEYTYDILVIDNKTYDVNELVDFKKKLAEFYGIIDSGSYDRINVEIPLEWDKVNIKGLSYVVTYETKKSRFKARRNYFFGDIIRIEIEEYHDSNKQRGS